MRSIIPMLSAKRAAAQAEEVACTNEIHDPHMLARLARAGLPSMYSQQQLDQALATLKLANQRTDTLTQMASSSSSTCSGHLVDVQTMVRY